MSEDKMSELKVIISNGADRNKKTYIASCVVPVVKETLCVGPDRPEGPARDVLCLSSILQVEAEVLTDGVDPSPELSNN
jgi:hypothetical protein